MHQISIMLGPTCHLLQASSSLLVLGGVSLRKTHFETCFVISKGSFPQKYFFETKALFVFPWEKPFENHKTCLEMGFSGGNNTQCQQCLLVRVFSIEVVHNL